MKKFSYLFMPETTVYFQLHLVSLKGDLKLSSDATPLSVWGRYYVFIFNKYPTQSSFNADQNLTSFLRHNCLLQYKDITYKGNETSPYMATV